MIIKNEFSFCHRSLRRNSIACADFGTIGLVHRRQLQNEKWKTIFNEGSMHHDKLASSRFECSMLFTGSFDCNSIELFHTIKEKKKIIRNWKTTICDNLIGIDRYGSKCIDVKLKCHSHQCRITDCLLIGNHLESSFNSNSIHIDMSLRHV